MDEVFGRYRLRGLLGAGGMGQVYRAFDTELHRQVAIKVLPQQASTDPTFEQRFRREARIAAGLGEPHVVPIYDSGQIEGQLFIAMQLIDGTDVATLLARQGRLSPERAVSIVEQAAAGLDAAHDAGLVHRDVKPANLLLTAKNFTYLIDFGIARGPGETQFTQPGAVVGTLPYMAPERFTTGTVDHRADIYALACVLHECLTGAKPFPDISLEQQMFAHVQAPRPQPSNAAPDIPAAFDAVIGTGMAIDPEQRFSTAGALAAAARAALTPPATAAPRTASVAASTRPWDSPATVDPETHRSPTAGAHLPTSRTSRRPLIIALTITVALGLGAIAWFTWNASGRDTRPTATAAKPSTVTPTIPVGRNPNKVAVDPSTQSAYATNYGDGTVSVIDTTNNTVKTTVHVGKHPSGVAVDPTTHTAYITDGEDDTVLVLNTTTNTVVRTIPVGRQPTGIALDPSTHIVYTANSASETVSVIDTTTDTVTATIPVSNHPTGVAVDPTTHFAYVANYFSVVMSVINTTTNTVATTIRGTNFAYDVAVDPTTDIVYVANGNDGNVLVISSTTNTVTATIAVGKVPKGVAVDPATHTAYATNFSDDTVSVVDTSNNTVKTTVHVGKGPSGVAVDPTTHTAYITNSGDNTMSVITRR